MGTEQMIDGNKGLTGQKNYASLREKNSDDLCSN